jgi:hypothetical protein
MMDLKSCYNFGNLTDSISLEQDLPCSFNIGGKEFNCKASVVLDTDWSADVRIEIQLDFGEALSFRALRTETNYIIIDGKQIPAFISEIDTSSSVMTKVTFTPAQEPFPIIGNDETRLSKVIFHLFNFKDKFGTSHKVIESENSFYRLGITEFKSTKWKVELHEIKKSEELANGKNRNPVLTHVGCLTRADNSEFNGKSAKQIMHDLREFFTFSQGYFCPPIMPVGFDKNEDRIWALGISLHHPVKNTMSWFDPHHSDQLAQLFPNFMLKLEDERWRETLHSVIYWYARSNNTSGSGIDTGIILSQIALERLAYEYSIDSQEKGEAYSKLTRASDKFRFLFSHLEIPQVIPDNFIQMRDLAAQEGFIDAPYFLTEFRNSMVHPDNKRRHLFSGLYPDTWRLGMWYLELAILKLCEYEGTYANRLQHDRWVGQVEGVPWLKNKIG